MKLVCSLLALLLLLPALAPGAEAASRTRIESFESGRLPAGWTTTTSSPSSLGVIQGPGALVKDGQYALSWDHRGGALRYTGPESFDHIDFYVRQGLHEKASGCLSVSFGNGVSYINLKPDQWQHVTLEAGANKVVTFASCGPTTGLFVFDLVRTYVREAESRLMVLPDNATFGFGVSDDRLILHVGGTDVNGPQDRTLGRTLGAIVTPTPTVVHGVGLGFRYNESYAGPGTTINVGPGEPIVVSTPVSPSILEGWRRSGTGIVVYSNGREATFVPLLGQVWVLA
ncbi:MAG TPA: hypothetical protein VNZ52_07995 [Candidatus Thermoplasmatota archaeon]|nr:hypothetical protein [Candidatus Thermoplasmatota archaeon]